MPLSASLPFRLVTALLQRVTSVHGVVPFSSSSKSSLSLASTLCGLGANFRRQARNAPPTAFLAIDFVLVPHADLRMKGLNYHYRGHAQTRLGHQFTTAALVKFGDDPTPLLERCKVSRLLETPLYRYHTATQEMIHTVNDCREAGVVFAGLLLDGEFGRDAAVTFSLHRVGVAAGREGLLAH